MPQTKILSPKEAEEKSKSLRSEGKIVILVGGCFDILHEGHIAFLKAAKKLDGVLFVMLESDESIRARKGSSRPLHTQTARASILSSIQDVDKIILLPHLKTDHDYDRLIFAIKPDIIATTKGDEAVTHKRRQANKIGAKLVEVINRIENVSTTRLKKVLDSNK